MLKILYPIHIDRWTSPIASLLREIAKYNHEFDFYSFSSPANDEDRELGQQFWSLPHIHRIKPLDILLHRYDVVHHASATPRNLAVAMFAKARSGGRTVHVFTANIQPHPEDRYLREYEQSLRRADVVVAVSEAVARDIEDQYGRRVDAIISNGVDLKFFSPKNATRLDLEVLGIQKPYVLFCAVLTKRKRPDLFIQLARLLPTVNFVMIGGFYQHAEAEAKQYLAQVRGVPNVKYLGRQPRKMVRDLMAQATALVFPSEVEGLPLTVIEALAMGLPVLAQPKSSLPEVVIPGKTGWLLNGDSLEEWAVVLKQILSWDTQKRKSFARVARSFVKERFSWEVIARHYKNLYLEITGKAGIQDESGIQDE